MRYRFADLVLESELPLPELPVVRSGRRECSIRFGPVESASAPRIQWDHHWRSPDGRISLSCARDGNEYRLGVPGLATFQIDDDGRAITCRPHPAVPTPTLEHLLIDQVLPRVLTHRGRIMIHAGCVATSEGALAFLGDSGAGKSTLCAEFARAGYSLLSDDGIVIRPAATGRFEAVATYPGLRLHPGPLAALFDRHQAQGALVAHYTKKRRVDRLGVLIRRAAGPHPLKALYVLASGPTIAVDPLPQREAFLALLRASFQLHLDDPERAREVFERLGAILDSVPARRIRYPRDFRSLGEVRSALMADLAQLIAAD